MSEEYQLNPQELDEAEEQHRQLHRTAFTKVRGAVHEIAAELQEQGAEEAEAWCAVESACRSVSGEAGTLMHIAEMRAEGAPESFVRIIEEVAKFGVEINSGQYDEPLTVAEQKTIDSEDDADLEEDVDDETSGGPMWGES